MNNVVAFHRREYVVIDCGYVRIRLQDQQGYHLWSARHFRCWVEWIEPDGGANIVWSGDSYVDAVRAAFDWNLPVIDRTGGSQ